LIEHDFYNNNNSAICELVNNSGILIHKLKSFTYLLILFIYAEWGPPILYILG